MTMQLNYEYEGTSEINNVYYRDFTTDEDEWSHYSYKTISITTTLNEMNDGEEFLTWLKANAVKVTEISFTIQGTTFYAEPGMTWSEWCDSSYNVPNENGVDYIIYYGELYEDGVFIPIADESNNRLPQEDKIVNGANYVYWAYVD